MVRYPKFLSTKPKFLGLSVVDVASFAVLTNILSLIGLSLYIAAILGLVCVILKIILGKWVDFTALFVSYPKIESFSWSEELERGRKDQ